MSKKLILNLSVQEDEGIYIVRCNEFDVIVSSSSPAASISQVKKIIFLTAENL